MQTVVADSLGTCEHCGVVVCIENMPGDSADAKWACPRCGKELGSKTFGYEEKGGSWEKTAWVNAQGELSSEKPAEDFELGQFFVIHDARGFGTLW